MQSGASLYQIACPRRVSARGWYRALCPRLSRGCSISPHTKNATKGETSPGYTRLIIYPPLLPALSPARLQCLDKARARWRGYTTEAARIARALLDALSEYPDYRLPELYSGYSRDETGIPVDYPTANRPQAWASCAIFLLAATMAGIQPMAWEAEAPPSAVSCKPFLPAGIDRLRLDGVWQDRCLLDVDLARDGTYIARQVRQAPDSSARSA